MMYGWGQGGWSIMSYLGLSPSMAWLLPVLLIWSLIWKGLALWKAARRGENVWFVFLLIINTLGILEILYLYVFSKKVRPVRN